MTNRHYCCVNGCYNNKRHKKYSFFFLPKDSERRNEWLKVMGRPDLLSKADIKFNSYQVCSAHFDKSVMSEVLVRKLTQDAVPTKYLPNDDPQPYDDEEERRIQAEAKRIKTEANASHDTKNPWHVTLRREISTQTHCSFVKKFSGDKPTSGAGAKKPTPPRIPSILIKKTSVGAPSGKATKRKLRTNEVPENNVEEKQESYEVHQVQEVQEGPEVHEVQTVLIKVEPMDMSDYE